MTCVNYAEVLRNREIINKNKDHYYETILLYLNLTTVLELVSIL